MTPAVSVVVTPPEAALLRVEGGARRYIFGGDRYRGWADEALRPLGEVRHVDWEPGSPTEVLAEAVDPHLPDADALVFAPWLIEPPRFDEDRLGRAANLKVIAGTFDYRLGWIDLDEAERRGVMVVDTSRTMTPTVAEYGVGITFALLRDIPAAIDVVRSGGWFEGPQGEDGFVFRDLADCRIGLAGYGTINRHYRRFIRPYGCEVAIYDPFVGEDAAAEDGVILADSLVELARRSDILVVAIPPTPSTLGVIDANVINALAPGSLFVLLSRMAVVDQEALWRRVRAGELRAATDVFQPEPPPANAWFRTDANVLPTPHIAGNVLFAHERCFREACADAARILGGASGLHVATARDKRLYEGTLIAGASDEGTQ
jgi:phosphoglycerate dehydrogenase-like enzyme